MEKERTKTILLVEDEVLIAMSEQMVLEDYGYKVVTAESGEQAIEIVDTNPDIDLILMDINLSTKMLGTEAAEAILSRHDLPLIFLSSHIEKEVVRKTEGITSYGYIVKDSGEIVMIASIKMAFRLHDAKMQEKNIKVENQQIAQQWQNTFDSSNDAIWILDKDQNIIRGNKTAEKFFGKSSEEMLGKKCHEIVHQTNAPIPPCPFQKTLKSGDREKMELQNGDIWYQVIVDPIHNGNNELIGAVHLVTDITERKKTEEELKAKLKELQTFHKVTVGRELKMIELKSEVNDLLIKLGQKEKYMIV